MIFRNRILVPLFCGACVAAALFWAFYFPYDRMAVLRCIPMGADFVTLHEAPAGRWSEMGKSWLTRIVVASAGVEEALGTNGLAGDREFTRWFRRLAGKRVALAHVPRIGTSGCQAWVFASWVGGYSQRLRWLASLGMIEGVSRAGNHSGRSIWKVDLDMDLPETLSIALGDGVLMGCLSRDPNGVRRLLDAYDSAGGSASVLGLPAASSPVALAETTGYPADRGWVFWNPMPYPVFLDLDVHGQSTLRGRARGKYRYTRVPPPTAGTADIAGLDRLLGDIPQALIVAPSSCVEELLRELPRKFGLRRVETFLLRNREGGAVSNPYAFVCLLGGDHRGRLRSIVPRELEGMLTGIAIPVIIAGVRLGNPASGDELMTDLLDGLNAEKRLGIIGRKTQAGDMSVTVFEGTGSDFYSRLRMDERAAYAVCGEWLVLSSNLEILSKIVARYQRRESMEEASAARWLKAFETGASAGFGWCDLEAAGATCRDLLGIRLLTLDRSPAAMGERELINEAMKWAGVVRQMKEGRVFVASDEHGSEARFSLGSL